MQPSFIYHVIRLQCTQRILCLGRLQHYSIGVTVLGFLVSTGVSDIRHKALREEEPADPRWRKYLDLKLAFEELDQTHEDFFVWVPVDFSLRLALEEHPEAPLHSKLGLFESDVVGLLVGESKAAAELQNVAKAPFDELKEIAFLVVRDHHWSPAAIQVM